jgi:para-nitrobenzyl esterase
LLERAADVAFTGTGRTGSEVLHRYSELLGTSARRDVVAPFATDLMFRLPSIRLAAAAQQHNRSTYMFRFGWKGQLGAVHGLDVPFMFDTLDRSPDMLQMLGGTGAPQSVATVMHGAWANFVKTGSPRHHALPHWPAYDLNRRATMHLDVTSRVVDDPDGETRRLWGNTSY